MSTPLPMKSQITAEHVSRYVVEQIVKDSDLENRLRRETHTLPSGGMISGSDVGAFLGLLIKTLNAKNAIEVGTFTGYTAFKMASALPPDGKLICCDINSEWTSIGKKYWQEAGIHNRIDLRLAPALGTLNELVSERMIGKFDFAFIDADKTGYDSYYEVCLQLLRPGGLIVLDNMLWSGAVTDPTANDDSTLALKKLNLKISKDRRVRSVLLTVGDGLMLAYKN